MVRRPPGIRKKNSFLTPSGPGMLLKTKDRLEAENDRPGWLLENKGLILVSRQIELTNLNPYG